MSSAVAGHVRQPGKVRVLFLVGESRRTARLQQPDLFETLGQLDRGLLSNGNDLNGNFVFQVVVLQDLAGALAPIVRQEDLLARLEPDVHDGLEARSDELALAELPRQAALRDVQLAVEAHRVARVRRQVDAVGVVLLVGLDRLDRTGVPDAIGTGGAHPGTDDGPFGQALAG